MFTPPGHDPTAVKTVLFVFVIALLAHLCTMQLAHGESFLPPARSAATLSLRAEPKVTGNEIRLRDVARWSNTDKPTLDPIGDLVVARFGQGQGFRTLDLSELKDLLRDAGVNLATLDFVGPAACRASRMDATFAPGQAIEQKIAADAGVPALTVVATPDATGCTLRRALVEDLAQKLNLPADDLQLTFKPSDDATLARREPADHFSIRPQRTGNLGDVSWVVTVNDGQRIFISGNARAWRQQVIVTRPVPAHQPLVADDVEEKRQLADALPPDPALPMDRIMGQVAARDFKPGQVVTTIMVEPNKLVRNGQDVSVDTRIGGVNVLTAARALSDGALGQTVRLRNEETRQTFNAIVTGPKRVSLASAGMSGSVR